MLSKGVGMPSTFEPIELCSMTMVDIFNAHRNINIAHDELLDYMGGYFEPRQDDSLYEWLHDGNGSHATTI